jgi:hypothetical protein
VTTAQSWEGNAFSAEISSGQLIIHGADNTRLRIKVTGINTATVELDEGSGFVPHGTISFTP